MGITTFSGPIRTGRDIGPPSQNTRGTVVLHQAGTVLAGANTMKTQVQVPPNCRLIDVMANVRQAVSGIAAGVNIRIGTSADSARFATIPVSAAGNYRLPTAGSAAAFVSGLGTADFNLVVADATAQASAADLTQFDAVVNFYYVQLS